jgi:hypothetical protein
VIAALAWGARPRAPPATRRSRRWFRSSAGSSSRSRSRPEAHSGPPHVRANFSCPGARRSTARHRMCAGTATCVYVGLCWARCAERRERLRCADQELNASTLFVPWHKKKKRATPVVCWDSSARVRVCVNSRHMLQLHKDGARGDPCGCAGGLPADRECEHDHRKKKKKKIKSNISVNIGRMRLKSSSFDGQ